jgi:hypothetical protein
VYIVGVRVAWDKGGSEGNEHHQLRTQFAVHIRESCQKFKENNLLVIGDDT